MTSKRVLFIFRHAVGSTTRETLDAALVSAAFDQQVCLLFREGGIVQLAADADGGPAEDPAVAEALLSLPDYGIERIFACADSLARAGLTADALILRVEILDAAEQRALLRDQDAVLND